MVYNYLLPNARSALRTSDFASEQHAAIWDAICALDDAGSAVSPASVHTWLLSHGKSVPGGVQQLQEMCYLPISADVQPYVDAVKQASIRRGLERLGNNLQRLAHTASVSTEEALSQSAVALQQLEADAMSATKTDDLAQPLDVFLQQGSDYDWLIPGLIERIDRTIIVGPEGRGKSMLLRQIAIAGAAGLHPLSFEPIAPIRTMIVDLENPPSIIRRKVRTILDAALHTPGCQWDPDRCWVFCRPGGINPQVKSDRYELLAAANQAKPDLIVIGPLYKMIAGNPNQEENIMPTIEILERLRTSHSAAIVLEHHAPQGSSGPGARDMRPVGSSVWLRWPEYGLGMIPMDDSYHFMQLTTFKGGRDLRAWPDSIRYGRHWPWEVDQLAAR